MIALPEYAGRNLGVSPEPEPAQKAETPETRNDARDVECEDRISLSRIQQLTASCKTRIGRVRCSSKTTNCGFKCDSWA